MGQAWYEYCVRTRDRPAATGICLQVINGHDFTHLQITPGIHKNSAPKKREIIIMRVCYIFSRPKRKNWQAAKSFQVNETKLSQNKNHVNIFRSATANGTWHTPLVAFARGWEMFSLIVCVLVHVTRLLSVFFLLRIVCSCFCQE